MNTNLQISILLLTILGLLGLYGFFQATPEIRKEGVQPRIEITPKSFDFGEVDYGKVLKHSFQVKNNGSKLLEIKMVATSCPCTKAKIKNQISKIKYQKSKKEKKRNF